MKSQNTAQINDSEQGTILAEINGPASGPASKIRVFLTDDHPLIRIGMAGLVGEEPDMEVCGEAGTIAQSMALIEKCRPDVVCVDISLRGEDGIDLVKWIHAHNPAITILVYTMHEDEVSMHRAMQAGARAYLGKKEAPGRLVKMIRRLTSI